MTTYKKTLLITLTALISQAAFIQAAAAKRVAVRAAQAAKIFGTTKQAVITNVGYTKKYGGWVNLKAAEKRFSPIKPNQSLMPIKHSNQTDLLALPQPAMIIIDAQTPAATNFSFFTKLANASRQVLADIKKSAQQAGNKATQYLKNKPVQTLGGFFTSLGLTGGYLVNNRQDQNKVTNK